MDIYLHNFPSHTLFDYPSFIKRLNLKEIGFSIRSWVHNKEGSIRSWVQNKESIKGTWQALFSLFIENEVNLHSLEILDYPEYEYCDVFELILQNSNFIRNVKNFTLDFDSCKIDDNITKFLTFLCSSCNLISSFYYIFPFPPYDNHPTIEKSLSKFINSQKNLNKILIEEYIMKKKRVKYLAISDMFRGESEDLFSLKDKVKEFELYGIQVLEYLELYIDIDHLIKEIYL
ncbi:hypothetical protein GLOIN_2v1762341 [Rhizophagus irregularis DAOM 181602=DAOM 197198]|nr:hypothetical protein GLOIN_2v1762341 [Rhizophagus irregularis DAOM 181602=DAOM 197198]